MLSLNESDRLSAIGVFSDQSELDISNDVSWSYASQEMYSSISANMGVITGDKQSDGAYDRIQATAKFINISSNIGNVYVKDFGSLMSIRIKPEYLTLPVGSSGTYYVEGQYSSGSTKTITTGVNWRCAKTFVCTITNLGVVSAISQGESDVTATVTSNNFSDVAKFISIDPLLERLEISGASPVAKGLQENTF